MLIALFVVLNGFAVRYNKHVTSYLCGFGVDYSSSEYQQKKLEAEELAQEIAGEGIVMLKNDNNTLPLSNPALNVFGWGGCDNGFIYMGFGSGTASTYGQVPLYEGLRSAGFELNEDLCDLYNGVSFRRDTGWDSSSWKLYEPLDILTDEVMTNAAEFSDTAMIVFSRFGMEGHDLPKYQNDKNGNNTDNGRTYLQLTPDEETLISKVTATFDNVIVVINSANSMEMGFLDNEKIGAALDIYFPGNTGSYSLGKILSGELTPSGRTVDTFAYDHTTAASYANMANGRTRYTVEGVTAEDDRPLYTDYAESIYIGYYWYETADAEGFWNSDFAKEKWGIKDGYKDVVQYPFGYGLSYTTFDWRVEKTNLPLSSELSDDSIIEVSVTVTNTGEWSGSDVVQLYYSAPYTKGGIEKPIVKLGAFAKTVLLKPGQSETVKLTLSLRDMASYDCYDANNNGFMGYEAEVGQYTLTLRSDAHTVVDVEGTSMGEMPYFVKDTVKYDKDEVTGNAVGNLFTTYTNPTSGATSTNTEEALSQSNFAASIDGKDSDQNIVYMTRANFAGTFPVEFVKRSMSTDMYSKTFQQNAVKNNNDDVAPKQGSNATHYTLKDMYVTNSEGKIIGLVDYNDSKWDDLVSQLTVKEMADLCGDGGLHTREIASIGKPACKDSDGPSGFNTTIFGSDKYGGYAASYPCEVMVASTWNWKMAYMMGRSVGGEGYEAKIQGWYGPACDLHRGPYGGRNYEYYSEDPTLSGVMVAYTVKGAKEVGLYSYVKHFAVNEGEGTREGGYTWLTEQTARELYFAPFENAVKVGGTLGIMSAYNRIGSTRTSGSYNLLTSLLRDEWGFKGCVISDYNNNPPVLCPDEAIRAGNDLMMEQSGGAFMFDDKSSATAIKSLHNSSKNILYCYAAAQYSRATSTEMNLDSILNSGTTVFAWWVIVLVLVDIGVVAGCVFWAIKVWKPTKSKKEGTALAE